MAGPGKGTATITNTSTGAYTYVPNANANGADSFTFRTYDGTAYSNTATVSVTINPANDVPVASNGSLSVSGRNPAAGTLVASDADGNSLTYSIVNAPTKGTLTVTNAATGAFTYTANANTTAIDSFTFRVNDRTVNSNTATVSVSITANNTAPVAKDGTVKVKGKKPASDNLVATDIDSNNLTYSIVSSPSKGPLTITNAATGAYTYTANSNTPATDSFTFRAHDGSAYSYTATVTVSNRESLQR